MRRAATLSILLLAACPGGGGKNGNTIGKGSGSGTGTGSDVTAPDPHLDARKAFSNPGGMWLPRQMDLPQHQAALEAMGVDIDAASLTDPLASPLGAIVSLDVCTGSFVSPDGLVITNHHCVQSALEANSSPDNDLVENGFLAKTRDAELPANPDQRMLVEQAFRDVTEEMTQGLADITDATKRRQESEDRQKAMVAECEKGRPGIKCSVAKYFRGSEYQLIEYLEIRDVRVVYSPQRSVGNYGGEIDNWAWPRHTGDFSFYRAYVAPDGSGAAYSKDNVPYKPKHWLQVAKDGLSTNDFVMVVGYPGSTERLHTLAEVQHDVDFTYPYLIGYLQQYYDLLDKLVATGGETGLKAGVFKQFIQNALENQQGTLKGLTESDLLQKKQELDAKVRAWAAEPGREDYATAIAKFDELLAKDFETAKADFDLGITLNSSLLQEAMFFVELAEERAKPDAERKPEYQDRVMPMHEAKEQGFEQQYDATIDRQVFELGLRRALALPEAQRPWLRTILGAGKKQKLDDALITKVAGEMYKKSFLAKQEPRMQLLKSATTKSLKKSKDPFIKLALALRPMMKAKEAEDDARAGDYLLAAPKYGAAMREALGGFLSPDANSTLRITYGTVKPFQPGEAAFTKITEIPAKDSGQNPFDAPEKELNTIAAKKWGPYTDATLGEVPVNFLSDLDITGGNSGSPTLNDKGELVGLAFDGTLAGVASDVVFDGSVTRTIHCDIRYALWIMDAVDGADNVLEELGVEPKL